MNVIVIYLIVVAVSVLISYFIFNWFMMPTKELLKEQTRLLRKLAGEEEPQKAEQAEQAEPNYVPVVFGIVALLVIAAFFIIAK